jgi:hypothetical protein
MLNGAVANFVDCIRVRTTGSSPLTLVAFLMQQQRLTSILSQFRRIFEIQAARKV